MSQSKIRRLLLALLIVASLVTLALPSASGQEFQCQLCFSNACGFIGANDSGWANCFIREYCFGSPGDPVSFCNYTCTLTESCLFDPTGW